MAAGGVLSSMFTTMVAKVHSLAFSSTSTSSSSLPHNNIEQEMSKLTETMRRIQAKLADSEEENHERSHSEKLWLSELKDVAYDAEDVVEEYEYEVRRSKQLHKSNSGTDEVRNSSVIAFVNTSIIMDELANKAAEVKKRFDEITKEWKLLTLPENAGKRKRSPLLLDMNRETSSLVVESDVLGREKEKDMLVEWLLLEDDTTGNGLSVIVIVGMGGLGKTTLAQLVYNDPRVTNYFDLRGWVCVSKNFHVVSLTEKILQSFTKVKVHEDLDGLQHALHENLQGKKFLLILDDVWNEEFTLWDELRKPLVSAQVGKVIVTTRNRQVARIMQTRSPLNLNCLPFDVCWSFFKKVTLGGANKSLQPHLEDLGRKIVDKCNGLPLVVKMLGGALRNKEDIDSWEDILENEMWESEETNNRVLPALKISYDCMPIQLKRCFQFLCLFPKNRCLFSEEIVRLWMSQDLLPFDGDKRAEDIGRNYIKKLVERSMLNRFEFYNLILDGPLFRMHDLVHDHGPLFQMHDLVHDLAQYVAQDECFCVMDTNLDTMKLQKFRHLSVNIRYHMPKNDEQLQLQKVLQAITDLQQLKLLRTLFITNITVGAAFDTRQDKFFGVLDDLFQKMKYIRALELKYIGIAELPDSLGNLKLLRYLSIEDIDIESFPESICSLYNLQILKIDSRKSFKLPRHIGNLTNLRHLWFSDQVAFVPSGIGNLTNLQTLKHFKVSCEKEHCDIGELNSLMKLGGHISIANVFYVDKFSNSKPPLKTKKYLDSLKLYWAGEYWDWVWDGLDEDFEFLQKAEQQLEYLHPHINIQSLQIDNYPGVKFVGWVADSSFTKLTILRLKHCHNCTKLPPLGQLLSLEELQICGMNGVQHVGREFCSTQLQTASPSSSQNKIAFPSLKCLVFGSMAKWEAWDGVEIDDFPRLQSIRIEQCNEMIKFPQRPFMSSVKEMTLDNCGVPDVSNLHSLTYLDLVVKKEHSEWMSKCYFPMLQHLKLFCQVESVRLSQIQMPSLKTLEIRNSEPLRVVAGLKNLTSLNSLVIEFCHNLEFEELPATLQQLKLKYCRLFKKGFQEQQGHMLNMLALDVHDD